MEKEALVLDASVIVKWFCEEEYTDIALGIRDRFLGGELNVVVPELMFYEVSNAIRYNKVLSLEEKLALVDDMFSLDFDVVASNNEILSEAMKSALDTDTPIYDNVYLAVGRLSRCDLITADKVFQDKVNTNDGVFVGELE
ncbi:MAG: PIN domain-containing protein [Methanophagales archaeon ANME-1-THS]|nr:MAG: PIN domain-containing protein [Methanophagales archaeon ANME-1-THS]